VSYGEPTSYLEAATGIDVISSDGDRVGALEHILADEQSSIFDGIVIDIRTGPGGHRFVDAPQVTEFYEQAVVIDVAASDVEALPEPTANPAVMENHGDEDSESPLTTKLRRAWNYISGNY
jgi:uncharacterized protein YrrD